jgi:hypothetical protein
MIKDAKGRKWFMRFKYRGKPLVPHGGALARAVKTGRMRPSARQRGWQWEARHEMYGQSSGLKLFATKALAENDARRRIQGHDSIAYSQEFLRRMNMRGSECQLTAADKKAIADAGKVGAS